MLDTPLTEKQKRDLAALQSIATMFSRSSGNLEKLGVASASAAAAAIAIAGVALARQGLKLNLLFLIFSLSFFIVGSVVGLGYSVFASALASECDLCTADVQRGVLPGRHPEAFGQEKAPTPKEELASLKPHYERLPRKLALVVVCFTLGFLSYAIFSIQALLAISHIPASK